jgi:signal peptidase I
MTVHEPETEYVGAGVSHDAGPELVSVGQRPRGNGAPAPARRSDYRLRGLDLEAQELAEAQRPLMRKKHASRGRRRRRLVIQWVAVLTFLAATAVLLRISVMQPYSVRSTSMVPTLQPGTNVLVVRPKLLTGSIKTGDIVVFHGPNPLSCRVAGDDSTELVKRVIGLPGQTIWSAKERIYIDGEPLKESGWYNPPYGEVGPTQIVPTTIPAGSYFVMGDNRTDPCDSRSFGPIAGSSLVGKVVITTTRNGHPYVRGI